MLLPFTVSATQDPAAHSLYSLPGPSEITEIFLRFHDEDLCHGVEAVFVPDTEGLKIWCRVKDKGDYRKFLKMLREPSEYIRLEIYSADPVAEEEDDDEEKDSLPPSLWENRELRDMLWRPLIQSSIFSDSDTPVSMVSPEEIYKQHLRIFSEQTLKKGAELEQYATELPVLTPMIYGLSADNRLRRLAVQVCRKHANKVKNLVGKLEDNMREALPGNIKESDLNMEDSSPLESQDIKDLAAGISEKSRDVSRSVHSFIYPEQHTVQLNELRHPDILSALKELRELNEAYLRKLEKLSADF